MNSRRGGVGYLLPCQPPVWKNYFEMPLDDASFWDVYEYRIHHIRDNLIKYLESKLHQKSLWETRKTRARFIVQLEDELLEHAEKIRSITRKMKPDKDDKKHWRHKNKLSPPMKIWLDPSNPNLTEEQLMDDWEKKIAKNFATWLNNQFNAKDNKLFAGDSEHETWKKAFKRRIKRSRQVSV